MIDKKHLKINHYQLLNHMRKEELHYNERYIYNIANEISRLIYCELEFESYEDYYIYRLSKDKRDKKYRQPYKSYINLIMNFDIYGLYPNGSQNIHQLLEHEKIFKYCEEFSEMIECFNELAQFQDKNKRTKKDQLYELQHFLKLAQETDINKIKNIDEQFIISYFMDSEENIIRGYSSRYRLMSALSTVSEQFDYCNVIIYLLPKLTAHRKNIQYLTDEEITKIKNILKNKPDKILYRDIALVTLLIHTGLRGIDIANLKLTDIDWDQETITIIQSKTSQQLVLPLMAVVGNAIYQYISNERVDTDCKYLFLKIRIKYIDKISACSVATAVKNIMNAANIRMKPTDRRGTHIFRHKLATKMLEREIPAPVIISTLGHSSPATLEKYVSSDLIHLKECGLSISQYPIHRAGGSDDE